MESAPLYISHYIQDEKNENQCHITAECWRPNQDPICPQNLLLPLSLTCL